MNIILNTLMGLIAGYLIGIVLAAIVAFGIGWEDQARFIAIGCGVLGAILGTPVAGALSRRNR